MKIALLFTILCVGALNGMETTEISEKRCQLTIEEQTLKEQIQILSQDKVFNAWDSFFKQQEIYLSQAQQDPAFVSLKLQDGSKIELPVYVLPDNYKLIVAGVGFSSFEICQLGKESNPQASAQLIFFWKNRYLNSTSVIKKELNTYPAATNLQLNMAFIIEPHKGSIIASASKDMAAPTKDKEKAVTFALEKIKLLSQPEDILNETKYYNEIVLLGPSLFNKLFPNYGSSFTIKGIFVTAEALRQYQKTPNLIESRKFLECLSALEQKNIFIYIPPKQ